MYSLMDIKSMNNAAAQDDLMRAVVRDHPQWDLVGIQNVVDNFVRSIDDDEKRRGFFAAYPDLEAVLYFVQELQTKKGAPA